MNQDSIRPRYYYLKEAGYLIPVAFTVCRFVHAAGITKMAFDSLDGALITTELAPNVSVIHEDELANIISVLATGLPYRG
jgi:hypothetical protein